MPQKSSEPKRPVRFYLNEARKLAKDDKFRDALNHVDEALECVKHFAEAARCDDVKNDILARRCRRIQLLREQLEHVFQIPMTKLTHDAVQNGRKALDNLKEMISSVDPDVELLTQLRKRWEFHEAEVAEFKQDLSKKLEQILDLSTEKLTPEKCNEADELLHQMHCLKTVPDDLQKRWVENRKKEEEERGKEYKKSFKKISVWEEEKNFVEAFAALDKASLYANADQLDNLKTLRRNLQKRRQIFTEILTSRLKCLLASGLDNRSRTSMDEGEVIIMKLQQTCDPDVGQIWAGFWEEHCDQRQIAIDLKETRSKLEQLWESPYLLQDRYDQAVDLATSKAQQYQDQPAFHRLLEEAHQHRYRAYDFVKPILDRAAQGDIEPLLKEMQQLKTAGCEFLPLYQKGTKEWKQNGVTIASEAIACLVEAEDLRQAEICDSKAKKCLKQDPIHAKKYFEIIFSLKHLPENKRDRYQAFYNKHITPAIKKVQNIESLLAKSRTLIDAQQPELEPEEAWGLFEESWELYHRACSEANHKIPLVHEAASYHIPRYQAYLDGRLGVLEGTFDYYELDHISLLVDRIVELTEGVSDFIHQNQRVKKLQERYRKSRSG